MPTSLADRLSHLGGAVCRHGLGAALRIEIGGRPFYTEPVEKRFPGNFRLSHETLEIDDPDINSVSAPCRQGINCELYMIEQVFEVVGVIIHWGEPAQPDRDGYVGRVTKDGGKSCLWVDLCDITGNRQVERRLVYDPLWRSDQPLNASSIRLRKFVQQRSSLSGGHRHDVLLPEQQVL